MTEPKRPIFVVRVLNEYRNVFNDDWGAHFLEVTAKASKLDGLGLDLVMEWRASVYTAAMPPTILDHVKAFYDGFIRARHIDTTLVKLAEAIPARLLRRLPELSGDPELVRKLQREIVQLGSDVHEANKQHEEFDIEKAWNEYLTHHVFQLSLWGSQRICYLAIYNSYENFVLQCVKLRIPGEKCRVTTTDFKSQLSRAFGDDMLQQCWTHEAVNIARVARHSLSHAGGRVTDDLEKLKKKHGFVVVDDRIQVTPADMKSLLSTLKHAAMELANRAAGMQEFQ